MLLAIFLVIYTPLLSVLLLRRLNVFKRIKSNFKFLVQSLAFIFLAALIVLVIRVNPYDNLGWLLLYAIIITIVYGLIVFSQRKSKVT